MKLAIDGIEGTFVPDVVVEDTFNDWRLPTIEELVGLIDYNNYGPAIVSGIKDVSTSDYYWSSTTSVSTTNYAWHVDFYYGDVGSNYKYNSRYVRCVRDGINGLEWSASSPCTMNWQEAKEYAKTLVALVHYKDKR